MQNVHLSLPVVVAFLLAALAAFTRVADASKPLWGRLPGWLQVALPQVLVVATALEQKLAAGVGTWTDFFVVLVSSCALLAPGAPSHRSDAPLPGSGPTVPPNLTLLALCLAFIVALLGVGCTPAALQAAETVIAELATWIADAANALTIAERTAAQFQLPPDLQAKFDDADRRARDLLAAAAAADSGAKDLTQQQLDASFQEFAKAWTDIEQVFAAARAGRNGAALHELPTPLCVKAVRK